MYSICLSDRLWMHLNLKHSEGLGTGSTISNKKYSLQQKHKCLHYESAMFTHTHTHRGRSGT